MAKTVTLLQLRNAARNQADMENSTFITDANLTVMVNNSCDALYDLILNQDPDYAVSSSSFTLTGTTDVQNLPSDFYRLRGIDDLTNTDHPCAIRPFNFAERNDYSYRRMSTLPTEYSNVQYILSGSQVKFTPPELAQKSYKLWYNPVRTDLSADSDTFDSVNGWDEWVIYDTAIKMMMKEESSTTALERLRTEALAKVKTAIPNRDMSQPKKIVRIRKNRSSRDGLPYY